MECMEYTIDLERKRKRFFFSLCCLIIFFVFFVITVVNWLQQDSSELVIDVLVLFIMAGGFIAVKTLDIDTTIYFVIHSLISLLLLYSIFIGAGKEMGILWVFFMPILFFFFFGKRQGLLWAISFLTGVSLIMLFPRIFNGHVYSHETVWRFLITLIAITTFSYGLESSRYFFGKLLEEKNRMLLREKDRLDKALKEIKTLSGLIPICSNCKKIRNDRGYWETVEVYVTNHSDATFSHGICPDCSSILYPWMKHKK